MDRVEKAILEIEPIPLISPAEKLMLLDDTAKTIEIIKEESPDTLVFLDKSARPLYWLIHAGYRTEEKFPLVRFLNIGSEKGMEFSWVTELGEYPELKQKRESKPNKVMVLDEKSSGGNLKKAKRLVQKLFNLPEDRVVCVSVLTVFPSWYDDPSKIGVEDPGDKATNLLSQRHPTTEDARSLRKELINMTGKLQQFLEKYSSFQPIEEKVKAGEPADPRDLLKRLNLSPMWNSDFFLYICDASDLKRLAEKVEKGEIGLNEAMEIYYLIKYNRLHPDDWSQGKGNYYDFECPSLNHLAETIFHKL